LKLVGNDQEAVKTMKKQTIFLMGFFMIIIIALGVSLLGCGG